MLPVLKKLVLSALLTCSILSMSCGDQRSDAGHVSSVNAQPERFALVADSLATALFADSTFGRAPQSRPETYAQLQAILGLMATFKDVLRNNPDLFRVWQSRGDMNQTFGPYTNRYRSLYHTLASYRRDGAQIVTESAIISSKVEPESFSKHIANYTNWTVKDFSSLIFALGSNDICNSWQNAEQFEQNYRTALRDLTTTYPGRNLYIVSPPHIPRLADPEIAQTNMFGMANLQCRDYFEIIACPAYRDVGRFHDFISRIRKVAAEYPEAVLIDVSNEPIRLEDLSGDCFHPSFEGHQRFTTILSDRFHRRT